VESVPSGQRFNSKPFARTSRAGDRDRRPIRSPDRFLASERHNVTASSLDPPISDLVSVDVTDVGAAVHVTVTGEVDSASAPSLRTELDAVLDGSPVEVVLDLRGVGFLDSAGLSVLAAAHRRAGVDGVRLRVLASGRAVKRPMQITGLWDLLGVEQVSPGA
jgi:anti-sigma B factor antagonist